MVECHLVSAKDQSRLHQFGTKVLPGIFFGYVLYAGGIWKGRHHGRRHWRIEADGRIWTPRPKAQCKGSVNANEREQISHPQSQMEQSQFLEEIKIWEHPPKSGTTQTEEMIKILRGESEGSSSTPRQDWSWYDGEAKSDFWSVSGDIIYRHHVEPRVKLYVPTGGSLPIPLGYVDVTRTTDTTLDVMSEKHVEDCWNMEIVNCHIRGLVSQDSPNWAKSHQMDLHGPGWRLTRKQTTSRPDKLWPEMWKHVWRIKTWRETDVGYRETKAR